MALAITSQPMDKYERDLMQIFNCDTQWPVCLYDFSFKNKNPTYLCLRVANDLTSYAYDNYFYGKNQNLQQESPEYQPGLFKNENRNEMLVERNQHLCSCAAFPQFVEHFKVRYSAHDNSLLMNPCLTDFQPDDVELHKLHQQFALIISQELTP